MNKLVLAVLVVFVVLSTTSNVQSLYVALQRDTADIVRLDVRTYFQHPPPEGTYLPWITDIMQDGCAPEIDVVYDAATNIYSIPNWGSQVDDFGTAGGISMIFQIIDLQHFAHNILARGDVWSSSPSSVDDGEDNCGDLIQRMTTLIFNDLMSKRFDAHAMMQTNNMGAMVTVFCKTPATDAEATRCANRGNEGCDAYQITGYYPCDSGTFFRLLQLSNGQKSMFGSIA